MSTFMDNEIFDVIKQELILWYLNYDNINITEKEIYEYSKLYCIPFQIFLKKLLERIINLDKYDINIIIDIIQNKMNLELEDKAEQYIQDLIPIVKSIKIIERAKISSFKLYKHTNYFYNNLVINKQSNHKGQPLPDIQKGRPFINWKKCYYENCYEYFKTDKELIKHLKYYDAYTPNYHVFHEQIIKEHSLTENKIIQENITKCPALICDKNTFYSPEKLIKHFQELGLEPFWKPGMIKQKSNYYFNPKIKIFNSDECIICCENTPNVIFDICLHSCFCVECYEIELKFNSIKKCPVCRQGYDKIYPC